jgi:hypothetical protein
MANGFPPAREADLVTFSLNFKTKITASPTTYSLTAAQATSYGTLHDAFVASYTTATDPATRSPMNIAEKDDKKLALVENLRLLAGIVQRAPGTTNPMRIDLGLPTRNFEPAPVPPPADPPQVAVRSVNGRTAHLRLEDVANPSRRGKPAGVFGAAVFSHVGATPPAELADWKFEGNTGRTKFEVNFPSDTPAGATVWFTAFWFNQRKESGPPCDPICTNLPGGSVSSMAA